MNDLRYDGPDLEAETNSRAQGTLMAGVMIAEAAQQGRSARAERIGSAALAQDRALWLDGIHRSGLRDLPHCVQSRRQLFPLALRPRHPLIRHPLPLRAVAQVVDDRMQGDCRCQRAVGAAGEAGEPCGVAGA